MVASHIVTKLTKEQKILMKDLAQEWIDFVYKGTLKLDKELATESINWLMTFAGFHNPENIYFVSSPMAAQLKAQELTGIKQYYGFTGYGSIADYSWVAFYSLCEKIGLLDNNNFKNFKKLLLSGIYDMIILNEDHIIACELPSFVSSVDKDNTKKVLHCETRSAISWSDGFELFVIDGIKFSQQEHEKLQRNEWTAQDIMKIANIEKRCAIIKYFGGERIIKEFNGVLIDKSERGNFLYEISIPGIAIKSYILKYADPSTGRIYYDPPPYSAVVNATHRKADTAMAAKFSLTLNQYDELNTLNES